MLIPAISLSRKAKKKKKTSLQFFHWSEEGIVNIIAKYLKERKKKLRSKGMGRPPCCEKVGIKKGPWTPEEDIILVSYIQQHGPGNWRSVPTSTGTYIIYPKTIYYIYFLFLINYFSYCRHFFSFNIRIVAM